MLKYYSSSFVERPFSSSLTDSTYAKHKPIFSASKISSPRQLNWKAQYATPQVSAFTLTNNSQLSNTNYYQNKYSSSRTNYKSNIINNYNSGQNIKDSYHFQKQNQMSLSSGQGFNCMDLIIDTNPGSSAGKLYLGNVEAASNVLLLKNFNISAVLTVAKNIGISYKSDISAHKTILADDIDTFDLSKHFDEGIDFIAKKLKYTNVLVHCWAGVSRSSSMVIAYLMKVFNMSYYSAHDFTKEKRWIVSPNYGFQRQLKNYENQLKNPGFTTNSYSFSNSKYYRNY